MDNAKKLLHRSYDEDLSPEERKVLEVALLADPVLQQEKVHLNLLRDRLSSYQADFSSDFSNKIISKIYGFNQQDDFIKLFRTIALGGVAAILLILLTIYFTDGSLGLDALYGLTGYSPNEELFSYLN
ncbi:MAG: hypothetical protein WC341_15070 [Bacteroidales bacterium]|jgi:hypothetical protein